MQNKHKIERLFHKACQSGDIDALRNLMIAIELDTNVSDNYALQRAAECGDLERVKILVTQPDADVVDKNLAFLGAAKNGHFEIVQVFVDQTRVKSLVRDLAFQYVAENGYLEIMQFLVARPDIDAVSVSKYALRTARKNGYIKIVQFLVAQCDKSFALQYAINDNYLEILKVFVTLPEVSKIDKSFVFLHATEQGHLEIVQFLVTHTDIDSTVKKLALKRAVECGHLRVVEFLIYQPDVDAAAVMRRADGDHDSEVMKTFKKALVLHSGKAQSFFHSVRSKDLDNPIGYTDIASEIIKQVGRVTFAI